MFQTITAVCIGGTALLGGEGGYGRTVIGVLIICELNMLLMGLGLPSALQQCLLGILVIVLVAIYGRETHISMRI
jgi:ribose transport system permease protein